MPRTRPEAARRAGFSILELAIVLALLTAAAAVAIPLFFGRATITLDNAVTLLARDLRAAQNQAAIAGKDVLVEVLPDGDGYRVVDESGKLLESPTSGSDFVRHYPIEGVFKGVKLRLVEPAGGESLRFTRDGYAPQRGVLRLEYRGKTRELTVDSPDGLVAVQGLDRDWQDEGR